MVIRIGTDLMRSGRVGLEEAFGMVGVFLAAALFIQGVQIPLIIYPGLGDDPALISDDPQYKDERIEVITDNGLVREIVVRCSKQGPTGQGLTGLVRHDLVEGAFLDAQWTAHKTLSKAIVKTCSPA